MSSLVRGDIFKMPRQPCLQIHRRHHVTACGAARCHPSPGHGALTYTDMGVSAPAPLNQRRNPMRAKKVCGHATCYELVPAGTTYCAEHERQRGWPRRTGNTRSTATGHRARRERVLKRDGYRWQLRYEGICTGTATIVDHIVALGLGGADIDDNCQAACEPCHKRKTSREGHEARWGTAP